MCYEIRIAEVAKKITSCTIISLCGCNFRAITAQVQHLLIYTDLGVPQIMFTINTLKLRVPSSLGSVA